MTTQQYQKKCSKEYIKSIKFPKETSYLYGNPVGTVLPIETAIGKIMVIGPQPAAKLYFVDDIPDVPLYDATAPFSIEPYHDGSRVRSSYTGQELSEVILETLEIPRENCWLTSLVKVFLFDDDHVKKYHRLGKEIKENRSHYMEYANLSLPWIRQEIEIANPKAIILLGPEVISSLLLCSEKEAMELYYQVRWLKRKLSGRTAISSVCLLLELLWSVRPGIPGPGSSHFRSGPPRLRKSKGWRPSLPFDAHAGYFTTSFCEITSPVSTVILTRYSPGLKL